MKTLFFRILSAANKDEALTRAANAANSERERFGVDPAEFSAVPGSPFCYWVTPKWRRLFQELPSFEADGRTATVGASTKDDVRYARLWFEVPPHEVARSREATATRRWVMFAKGGRAARFHDDIYLVINWERDGRELKADISEYRGSRGWGYQWSAALNGHSYYFRPGLTWPHRSASFTAAALPSGCIFSNSGKAAFASHDELEWLLALFNSTPVSLLLRVQSDAVRIKYEAGLVQNLPAPIPNSDQKRELAALAARAWRLTTAGATRVETSYDFVKPGLLQAEGATLAARADICRTRAQAAQAELNAIQTDIDDRCFELYGIADADRRFTTAGVARDADGVDGETEITELDEEDDEDSGESTVDAAGLAADLVSWAVGVAFGRFDVRLATSERQWPVERGPFDALPVCPPAMLVNDDGLPVAAQPQGYAIDFPDNGILVDDPGHPHDLTAAVRRVFDTVFGASSADARWEEAAALLDRKGHDLGDWLRSAFFERHVKMYSRSRRKAPILCQLGTPSGRYIIWLYAHRLTDDSLFQLQNDVLAPKLSYEERQLTDLVESSGGSPSPRQRREIEAQERFVEELRALLAEVKRVAPLWSLTLDDGMVLVMAPLWSLVPHKPWQRELKQKWSELADGKYDWAQLAMHLWPERVVPKCREDRSLAIAHGLEGVFWFEDDDGQWKQRDKPTTAIEDLIAERTSPAVKDALLAAA